MKIKPEDKRLINCELDLNQLTPFRYQWAWDMFLAANANHWTPLDIAMADDVSQFNLGLPKEIEHLFLSNFAMLTTFDMLRGRDLAHSVMEKIDAPECKLYLGRQVYEEGLHTWTYQHVMEAINIDQEAIYSWYRTVPSMMRKAEMSQQWSDTANAADLTTSAGRADFLFALVFGYIGFEYGWFPMGFTIGHALARIGLMKRTAEQFQYIQRDELLHSDFGVNLINTFVIENPDVWTESNRETIKDVLRSVVKAEEAYIAYALPKPILGYSAKDHIDQLKYRLNLRATAIKIPNLYPSTQNVMPWLDEMVLTPKEVNFFEQRVKEYQKTSLSWEE